MSILVAVACLLSGMAGGMILAAVTAGRRKIPDAHEERILPAAEMLARRAAGQGTSFHDWTVTVGHPQCACEICRQSRRLTSE